MKNPRSMYTKIYMYMAKGPTMYEFKFGYLFIGISHVTCPGWEWWRLNNRFHVKWLKPKETANAKRYII